MAAPPTPAPLSLEQLLEAVDTDGAGGMKWGTFPTCPANPGTLKTYPTPDVCRALRAVGEPPAEAQ
jgi:hypothetical protein